MGRHKVATAVAVAGVCVRGQWSDGTVCIKGVTNNFVAIYPAR